MTATTSPARRLSAENRREQILSAAQALFIEYGFESVGMNDIAQVLGTSRPTIYTYFTSTEEILNALLVQRLPALWERLSPLLPCMNTFAANEYAALFRELLKERELLLLMHSGGGPTFRQQREQFLAHLTELIEPYRPQEAQRHPQALNLISLLLATAAVDTLRNDRDTAALAVTLGEFIAGGVQALRER